MPSQETNIVLNNGRLLPILGLGTWTGSKPGEITDAVRIAIDIGYRHIDGAMFYENESEVGRAVNSKIAEGVIKREDIFITSKLWNSFHRADLVRPTFDKTLRDLNTKYVDLYLIHWPVAYREEAGSLVPLDENGKMQFSYVDFLDTWKELEKLVDAGLVKSIGLSNFNKRQIERVLATCRIRPVCNQVECHPYLTQIKLSNYLREKQIALVAYCPLGSPSRPWAKPEDPNLLEDPKIANIGKKYNKTTSQILLRYQIDRGHSVIPKSANTDRLKSNFDILDFKLSTDDIETINSFNIGFRACAFDYDKGHPENPFDNDEF